ncbi:hypothetical protein [Streptomyces sp. NPDC048603]|uniref:hypothetical protein n=1 Tax=Streptomyces sp. NPDC048603 TaxID=3365577 RepID=UPI003724A927
MSERIRNAGDEVARLKAELKEQRLDTEYYKEWAHFNGHRLNAMIASRDRFRLAWLSARGRAADAYTYGAEAWDMRANEIATLSAELRRLQAFADEVRAVRGKTMCAETPRDLLESHLRPIYASLHELEAAQRERRPFVPRIQRDRGGGPAELRVRIHGSRLRCAGEDEDGSSVWVLDAG